MLRKKIAGKKRSSDSVQWRGHEITRIEAFSDAVFAFGITLLIVALEVPETYAQLMETMKFFLPFAICCVILFMIWYAQNIFFRRYGLHDTYTIVLNGVLLFLVLFFVYPLKFLFGSIFSHHFEPMNGMQIQNLFYIYSGGFAAIYIIFVLLYHNALLYSEQLKLTAVEVYDTKSHMYSYIVIAFIGFLSAFFAFLGGAFLDWAGLIYVFIGFGIGGMYKFRNVRKRKMPHLISRDTTIVAGNDISFAAKATEENIAKTDKQKKDSPHS